MSRGHPPVEGSRQLQAFTGPQWREAVILPEEAHLLKSTHLHHDQSFFLAPPKERATTIIV